MDDPVDWRTGTLEDNEGPSFTKGFTKNRHLVILNGRDSGRRVLLDHESMSIGRGEEADIVIEDRMISTVHCQLRLTGEAIVLEDCDSRNGVYVDGAQVKKAKLTPFSQIVVGRTAMRIDCLTEAELELQRALIQSERMSAVGTLAGGIAHEFNNINMCILGNCELLLQQRPIQDKTRKQLEAIRNSVLRASKLTTNLLAFAQRRSGGSTLAFDARPAQLNEVIQEILELVKEEFTTEGIVWDLHLNPVPSTLMDCSQIQQVLLNLLVNARHALLERSVKRIRLETGREGGTVWASVSDTGCGIPPEHLDRVFTPFFSTKGEHAHAPTPQSKVKGSGLGLSICQTILANHGGTLQLESTVEEGSTFTLRLPLQKTQTKPETVPADGPVGAGKHALIVEDEISLQEIYDAYLSALGFTCTTTDDGAVALQLLETQKVDLLALDLQMTKMSGIELLGKLRDAPLPTMPHIVVITGCDADTAESIGRDFDVDRIFRKPIEADAFGAGIRAVFGSSTS